MSGAAEELAIPVATREQILTRDARLCRLCGAHSEVLHVHHIVYRSQGGKNTRDNLVSLDWRCHDRVHSNKRIWLPVLQQVAVTDGVNGIQLLRWYRERAKLCPGS